MGAGTTNIALELACALAERTGGVAYLETNVCGCSLCMRRPMAFYRMNLQNRIFPGRFSDFFYMKYMKQDTGNRANLYKGVNWAVRRETSPLCLLLPEDIAGRYVIWDEPPVFEDDGRYRVSMDKLDLILCVTRPDAAYMISGAETIRTCLKEGGRKTLLVYNMINSKAALNSAERFIGKKGDFLIWNDLHEREKSIEKIAEYLAELY